LVKTAPFQIRGNSYTLLTLRMDDPWDPSFFMQLGKTVSQSVEFYRNAPVVLDLEPLAAAEPFNIAEFVRRLRQHQLAPVGAINVTEAWTKVVYGASLPLLPPGREGTLPLRPVGRPLPVPQPQAQPVPEPEPEPAPEPAAQREGAPARFVDEPVRSGRQVRSNGDLVVVGPVSHGAELVALGSIHVYGALRGRALAGLDDPTARIFCRSLEAELVAINGVYAVSEQLDGHRGKAVSVRLADERLVIDPLP
jgi:septum site-determining protein MinC